MQIEEKGGSKAIITGREAKEKEDDHDIMQRDKGEGLLLQISIKTAETQLCSQS